MSLAFVTRYAMVAIVEIPLKIRTLGERSEIDECSRARCPLRNKAPALTLPNESKVEVEVLPPRAIWKGFLKIAEVACPVALYAAVTSSERITLHIVNRATGHRVHRQYIDEATGAPVDPEDQVKGYETVKDQYVTLTPDEIAAAAPQSDKTLDVSAFLDGKDVDDVYFDRPYYLTPSDKSGEETFSLIREGLIASKTAAIARAVLFRRVRTVLILPYSTGLFAATLKFDYEVLPASDVFARVPKTKVTAEALDLAKHIIKTKQGAFDPADFHDRYEAALAALVKAKLEGKRIAPAKAPAPQSQRTLMDALRESAGLGEKRPPPSNPAAERSRAPRARKKAS